DDVVDLLLAGDVVAGAVVGCGVGSGGDEQVGEARRLDPEVRARVLSAGPLVGQGSAVPPGDLDTGGELELEPGGEDDDVGGDELALGGDHPVRGDALERGPVQADVVAVQGLVEPGVLDDPLAVRPEVRGQL